MIIYNGTFSKHLQLDPKTPRLQFIQQAKAARHDDFVTPARMICLWRRLGGMKMNEAAVLIVISVSKVNRHDLRSHCHQQKAGQNMTFSMPERKAHAPLYKPKNDRNQLQLKARSIYINYWVLNIHQYHHCGLTVAGDACGAGTTGLGNICFDFWFALSHLGQDPTQDTFERNFGSSKFQCGGFSIAGLPKTCSCTVPEGILRKKTSAPKSSSYSDALSFLLLWRWRLTGARLRAGSLDGRSRVSHLCDQVSVMLHCRNTNRLSLYRPMNFVNLPVAAFVFGGNGFGSAFVVAF